MTSPLRGLVDKVLDQFAGLNYLSRSNSESGDR